MIRFAFFCSFSSYVFFFPLLKNSCHENQFLLQLSCQSGKRLTGNILRGFSLCRFTVVTLQDLLSRLYLKAAV